MRCVNFVYFFLLPSSAESWLVRRCVIIAKHAKYHYQDEKPHAEVCSVDEFLFMTLTFGKYLSRMQILLHFVGSNFSGCREMKA